MSASDFEITSSRPKDFLNYINKLQWRRQAGARGAHAPPVIGLAPPVPPQDFMTMYTSMYLNCESCEMHLKRAINFHDNTQLSYTAWCALADKRSGFRPTVNEYTAPTSKLSTVTRKLIDQALTDESHSCLERCKTRECCCELISTYPDIAA